MTNGDKPVHLGLRIEQDLSDRIDQWRIVHMPLQPKAEAIRRLLEEALKAYEEKK